MIDNNLPCSVKFSLANISNSFEKDDINGIADSISKSVVLNAHAEIFQKRKKTSVQSKNFSSNVKYYP